MKVDERVISFSIKPDDREAQENVQLLKEHARSKGVHFSFLIIGAIEKETTRLNLKVKGK